MKAAYAFKGLTLSSLSLPELANQPILVWLHAPAERHWQVFVNPYTGQVIGDRALGNQLGWYYIRSRREVEEGKRLQL